MSRDPEGRDPGSRPDPPPLRPFARGLVPAPTGAESAEADRAAIGETGVPQPVLMENAGRSAAMVLDRLYPEGRVVAVVGKGNNGGDALVLLRTLAAWGRSVRAVVVGERGDDGLLHGWEVPLVRADGLDEEGWREALRGRVIVDGLLGTGIRGEPREPAAGAIRRMLEVRAEEVPVVALDVPSGVDADTGAAPGVAVEADLTVAFGWPKLGTLLHPGRARAGRLIVTEIGFPPRPGGTDGAGGFGAALVTPAWGRARLPTRQPETHKNAVGSVLVAAGRPGMAGAAVLATRAALRTGTGLVRVASASANREILQSSVPEAIFVDADDPGALADALEASGTVVAGPGLGTDAAAVRTLAALLDGVGDRPIVLDADALNLLARGEPRRVDDLPRGGEGVVVTPHPGEMARLTGRSTDRVQSDRPGTARGLVDRAGCTVLMKGTPSLVAAPGRPLLVDSLGSSDLAAGGMGDVLSGIVGALLAQGIGLPDAAAVGLVLSGRAAALADRRAGLIPTDVVEALPAAMAESGPGVSEVAAPWVVLDLDPAR